MKADELTFPPGLPSPPSLQTVGATCLRPPTIPCAIGVARTWKAEPWERSYGSEEINDGSFQKAVIRNLDI